MSDTERSGTEAAPPVERFYRGRSMAGVFEPGDLLIIEPIPLARVRRGDIVAYTPANPDPEGADAVHRVIAVVGRSLICRGDNNRFCDGEPVTGERLIGRVAQFERGGRIRRVDCGRAGMKRGRLNWTKRALMGGLRALVRPFYLGLRRVGVVRLVWKPAIHKIRFCSPQGFFIKYIRRGRTVACVRENGKITDVRRPFDLVLWKELEADRCRNSAVPGGPEV